MKCTKTKFKKSSTEKGITLVALIITIVVLLILAVVAISAIQNDGILSHAQNATGTYNNAVTNEQTMLNKYEAYLNGLQSGNQGGNGEDSETQPEVTAEIGDYIEYDVSYTDMYTTTEYTATTGWRYFGVDSDGNNLLMSTGIPLILYYASNGINIDDDAWWGTTAEADSEEHGVRAVYGLTHKFNSIQFTYDASDYWIPNGKENTGIFKQVGSTTSGNLPANAFVASNASGATVRVATKDEITAKIPSTSDGFRNVNNFYHLATVSESNEMALYAVGTTGDFSERGRI